MVFVFYFFKLSTSNNGEHQTFYCTSSQLYCSSASICVDQIWNFAWRKYIVMRYMYSVVIISKRVWVVLKRTVGFNSTFQSVCSDRFLEVLIMLMCCNKYKSCVANNILAAKLKKMTFA